MRPILYAVHAWGCFLGSELLNKIGAAFLLSYVKHICLIIPQKLLMLHADLLHNADNNKLFLYALRNAVV